MIKTKPFGHCTVATPPPDGFATHLKVDLATELFTHDAIAIARTDLLLGWTYHVFVTGLGQPMPTALPSTLLDAPPMSRKPAGHFAPTVCPALPVFDTHVNFFAVTCGVSAALSAAGIAFDPLDGPPHALRIIAAMNMLMRNVFMDRRLSTKTRSYI
ncbi:MAG TPA: hypothetical protein VKB39_08825 [Candidatus Baltobacteraceae bacterium]|nr:hypothetical protein [Candidatus Baltobacteraceae bacterium]